MEKINISKAAGPDLIPGRMLNMLAPELAPIVHAIFTQSLDTGELPRDWSLANVAPIFKKGNRGLAENYRPFSLTCITCKLCEHIVCRHILDHVEDHKILTNLQHGFRSGRSCETQLITTTHDLLSSFNSKSGPLNVLSIPGWEWSGSSHYLQNALMVMRLTQPLTAKS